MSEPTPLREHRLSRGLTLEAMANEIGCTITTLSRYELGQRTPRGQRLERLVRFTGLPVSKLVGVADAPLQPEGAQ